MHPSIGIAFLVERRRRSITFDINPTVPALLCTNGRWQVAYLAITPVWTLLVPLELRMKGFSWWSMI